MANSTAVLACRADVSRFVAGDRAIVQRDPHTSERHAFA